MSEFGDYLKDLRTTKNITLRELSDRTGVSHTQINRIENGQQSPKPATIKKIADGLDMDYNLLLSIAGHIDLNDELYKEIRETQRLISEIVKQIPKDELTKKIVNELDKLTSEDKKYIYELIKKIQK